jgi:hypothetical protein
MKVKLHRNSTGGKTLTVNGVAKYFPPIPGRSAGAYDSARGTGYGGQDDERDEDDRERDGEIFADEDDRELEKAIGAAVSDGLRRYKAARDKRRAGKDADPSDHLDDFDPLDERRAREAYRDRDGSSADEEILGQVPAKSTMSLRKRGTADSRLGFDSRRLTREQIDSRPAQAVAGRQVRGSLSDELDELFGHRGRA